MLDVYDEGTEEEIAATNWKKELEESFWEDKMVTCTSWIMIYLSSNNNRKLQVIALVSVERDPSGNASISSTMEVMMSNAVDQNRLQLNARTFW